MIFSIVGRTLYLRSTLIIHSQIAHTVDSSYGWLMFICLIKIWCLFQLGLSVWSVKTVWEKKYWCWCVSYALVTTDRSPPPPPPTCYNTGNHYSIVALTCGDDNYWLMNGTTSDHDQLWPIPYSRKHSREKTFVNQPRWVWTCPKLISWTKLSQVALKPRNSWRLSPSKVSHYTVLDLVHALHKMIA